jgi:hypothetical protein
MTTVFTVIGVKKLIYQTLQDDYGVLPNGGGTLGGGAGLTQAEVQALVDAAVANVVVGGGGVTQAAVDAAIAAAIATVAPSSGDLQSLIDGLAGRPSSPVSTAVNKINAALEVLSGLGPAVGNALAVLAGEAQPYPGEPAVDDAVLGWLAKIETSVAAWNAGGGLTPEQAVLLGQVQPLLDLLAVKPGATVADVAEVWEALSDTSVGFAQLLATLSGKPLSQNPTVADVQAGLPVLIQTIVDAAVANLPAGGPTPAAVTAAIVNWVTADVNTNTGIIGGYFSDFNQRLLDEVTTRTDETRGLEQGYQFLRTGKAEQTALDGVVDRVTALEGAALGGGEGVSQAVVDSLLARLDALEAENAALKVRVKNSEEVLGVTGNTLDQLQQNDAEIVEFMSTKLVTKEFFEIWEGSIVNLLSGIYTDINNLKALTQATLDAMNGPNATVESVQQMFWLLNDILVALIEATGIEIAGKVTP